MPTIGVAVAIPEPWASELQDFRGAVGDRMAAHIPTHITLVPPQQVSEVELDEVEQHLGEVAAGTEAFSVRLCGTGTFRPVSPVVFVQLREGGARCEQLADAVRRGPLDLDLDYPYHPHVTVAHHLDDDRLDRAASGLADFECRFDVTGFHLYVHDADVGWQPTHEFELGAR